MLSMAKINDIKYLKQVQGLSYRKVKTLTGHSYATIKKYEETENFNQTIKKIIRKTKKIDQYKEMVDKWILSDIGKIHKQRHTAKKIFMRLQEKYGDSLNISYRSIAIYVAEKKRELNLDTTEYLKLSHLPGTAQVDFGKLTFKQGGKDVKGSYLVLTLPYSNAGYMQIFRGETTECLLQGLKDIFKHIGGVPREIWFDNLTAAVAFRKNKDRILNESFDKFSAHYKFKPKFCNPASGNEKGNVENKVGYFRRNYFVPIPEIPNIAEYNKHLLRICDKDNERIHYHKNQKICDLLEMETNYLIALNINEYEVAKYERRKVNKYGFVDIDTNKYSVGTKFQLQEVWIKITAHKIFLMDKFKREIASHNRVYSRNKYVNTSWIEHLPLIIKKINSLEYTDFFQELPKIWKEYLLKLQSKDRKKALLVLEKILLNDSLEIATYVLQGLINAELEDPDILLLNYHKYKDNTGPREEIALSSPLPKIDKYETNLEIYNQLIKKKEE